MHGGAVDKHHADARQQVHDETEGDGWQQHKLQGLPARRMCGERAGKASALPQAAVPGHFLPGIFPECSFASVRTHHEVKGVANSTKGESDTS